MVAKGVLNALATDSMTCIDKQMILSQKLSTCKSQRGYFLQIHCQKRS